MITSEIFGISLTDASDDGNPGHEKALKAAELTGEFIRSIFLKLQQKVNEFTQAALSKVLAKGRAV